MKFFGRRAILSCIVMLVSACAGQRSYHDGLALAEKGQFEAGLSKLEEATKAEPDNLQYRSALLNLRLNAVNRWLLESDTALGHGRLDEAEVGYGRVLKLDKENPRAKAGLTSVAGARKHAEQMAAANASYAAGDFKDAEEKSRAVLRENPQHGEAKSLVAKLEEKRVHDRQVAPALRSNGNPISLEFRDVGVKMVFDILSSTTGINFILDKDLRPDQRVSIFVRQLSLDQVLDTLLETNQLEKKVLNENTVLIYPKTAQKDKAYKELLVRTFYLANADPKHTANMVKTILKTNDVYVDDRLNMLVLRDTPETIRLAEKLIAAQDLPEPEVLLEVEVIEVKRTRLLDLGIQYPLQFGVVNPTPANPLTLNALRNITGATVSVAPSPSVNLRSDVTNADILANPRIRVRNREKAKVHIGDRVPVITTSGSAANTGFISENVQYLDVGIKLEVEPNIYLEGDVAIKVNLEVSSLGAKTVTNNGSVVYQLGTRNASTLLRLRDGETQLLAGLINDEDRKSISGLPGLADIPLLGRLFSSQQDNRQKTEVILSITPHLVRSIVKPGADVTQFWAGTAGNGGSAYGDITGMASSVAEPSPIMPEPGQGQEAPVLPSVVNSIP